MDESRPGSPLLVRDLMSVGVPTCSPETPIADLTRVLLEKDLEGMVVLDKQGHAVGIVCRHDLILAYSRLVGSDDDFDRFKAEDVMQDGVPQIPPDIPLTAAAQIMQDQGQQVFFLMHHAGGIEYPAAMLSYKHLLRYIAMEDEEDLRDLGIRAQREAPLDAFMRRRDEAKQQAQFGREEW